MRNKRTESERGNTLKTKVQLSDAGELNFKIKQNTEKSDNRHDETRWNIVTPLKTYINTVYFGGRGQKKKFFPCRLSPNTTAFWTARGFGTVQGYTVKVKTSPDTNN